MKPRRGLAAVVSPIIVWAVLGVLGAACSGGGDDVDGDQATARLEQQRDDVREAARTLLEGAEEALPGRVTHEVGRFDGCQSIVPEGFRDFRFTGQAKVEVAAGPARAPFLDPLRRVLEDAGFGAEQERQPNGHVLLGGTRGDLSAFFVHTGAGQFVGLTVHGPCVEVPREDWPSWVSRDAGPLR